MDDLASGFGVDVRVFCLEYRCETETMVIFRAFRDGINRVNACPTIVISLFVVTLLTALPLGLILRDSLRTHLGDSVVAETVVSGIDWEWWQEFSAQSTDLGTTFSPSIIGFGVVLANISGTLDNKPIAGSLIWALTAYLFLWILFVGGVIDRYARKRPTRVSGFFSTCGIYHFRFLRLGIIAWLMYALLFGVVHALFFNDFYTWITRDLTVERNAFFVRLTLYLLFGMLLGATNLVLDYAKIRAVVEDRRSMIGAFLAGLRFVVRRPWKTSGLYLLNGIVFVIVLLAYAISAPGVDETGASTWLAFLIGQLYVLARLWTKLLFYASQTSFFQGELAHADYTAAAEKGYSEPPTAEAIEQVRMH